MTSSELIDLDTSRKLKREKGLNPPVLTDATLLLETEDVWLLSTFLPPDCRHRWRLLYSDTDKGRSWSVFSASIAEKGSVLLIIEDEDKNVFGGFAFEGLKKMPNFYGSKLNFLFSVKPKVGIYTPRYFFFFFLLSA